jgi:hypothetical protein
MIPVFDLVNHDRDKYNAVLQVTASGEEEKKNPANFIEGHHAISTIVPVKKGSEILISYEFASLLDCCL